VLNRSISSSYTEISPLRPYIDTGVSLTGGVSSAGPGLAQSVPVKRESCRNTAVRLYRRDRIPTNTREV